MSNKRPDISCFFVDHLKPIRLCTSLHIGMPSQDCSLLLLVEGVQRSPPETAYVWKRQTSKAHFIKLSKLKIPSADVHLCNLWTLHLNILRAEESTRRAVRIESLDGTAWVGVGLTYNEVVHKSNLGYASENLELIWIPGILSTIAPEGVLNHAAKPKNSQTVDRWILKLRYAWCVKKWVRRQLS